MLCMHVFLKIVCPSNAGSTGCGVYLTGDDVNSIYNSYNGGGSKRKLLAAAAGSSSTSRRLLADSCQSGAAEGKRLNIFV